MPKVNLGNAPDASDDDFPPFIVKDAPAHIKEFRCKITEGGNQMWSAYIEVADGEFSGRTCWDNWTWPETEEQIKSGMGKKIKIIASAFELPKGSDFEYLPEHFLGEGFDTIEVKGQTRYIAPNGMGLPFLLTTKEKVYNKKKSTEPEFNGYKSANSAVNVDADGKAPPF